MDFVKQGSSSNSYGTTVQPIVYENFAIWAVFEKKNKKDKCIKHTE